MMSYEIKFRERALSRVASGKSLRETAKLFGISRNTLSDWLGRKTGGESLAPCARVAGYKNIPPGLLPEIIRKTPDIYGCEIAERLGCSNYAVCYALRRHGYILKKTYPFSERDGKRREAFLETLRGVAPSKVSYVYETGIEAFLHCPKAWSQRGEPVEGRVGGRKLQRTGMVACQRRGEIVAPMCHEGTMDSQTFEVWFGGMLLARLCKWHVIVTDSAYSPRSPRLVPPKRAPVRRATRLRGVVPSPLFPGSQPDREIPGKTQVHAQENHVAMQVFDEGDKEGFQWYPLCIMAQIKTELTIFLPVRGESAGAKP